jgi:hypothetical protein
VEPTVGPASVDEFAGCIGQDAYARIRAGAREVLRPFMTPAGRLEVPLAGHLVAGRR